MKYIIITGNPVDGLGFVGPFKTAEEANRYADLSFTAGDWWVVSLDKPEREYV